MKTNKSLWLLAFVGAMFSSCVDENYNLSDLDTTVGVSVNNLTIPLNVDHLELDQVLELEEDDQIKKVEVNGKTIYALVEEGTFESDAIEIPGFTAAGQDIAPIEQQLKKNTAQTQHRTRGVGRSVEEPVGTYPIEDFSTSFDFSGDVDQAVKDIKKIAVKTFYQMDLDVSKTLAAIQDITKIEFENLIAKLPKGLEGTITLKATQGGKEVSYDITHKYNKSTGVLTGVPGDTLSTDNGQLSIRFDITAIDMTVSVNKSAQGAGKNSRADMNELVFENGTFKFNGEILVEEGDVAVYSDNPEFTIDDIPDEIEYSCTPSLDDIVVEQVTGDVEYAIDGINIDPVSLEDVPDVLGQEETNIVLANPQIYLSLNNPVAKNGLKAEAGLKLKAKREKGDEMEIHSSILEIDNAENVFCLTPNANFSKEELHADYKNAKVLEFAHFDEILSGNGLPKEIEIDVENPQIPKQTIENFELGQDIEKIKGKYLLFAPLALKDANSKIVYKETLDEWSDETLDKLVISHLNLKADITSQVPLSVTLKFHPIDVTGKKIESVETEPLELAVDDATQPIDVNIRGEIKHLDGVIIEAVLKGHNGEPVSPDNKLIIENLKVSVSGIYIDEL